MHPAPPASRDGASAGLASSGAARAHGELRAELRGLKMRSLHKRGEELGIDDDALDNAEQKSEIVELIIQRLAGQQAAREDAGRGAALKMGPSAAAPAFLEAGTGLHKKVTSQSFLMIRLLCSSPL